MIYLFLLIGDKIIKYFLFITSRNFLINEGMFFGINTSQLVTLFISLLIIGILYVFKKRFGVRHTGLNIIICGITMNISDRFLWGGVIDYIKFYNILSFNLADIIILIGMLAVIYSYISQNAKLSIGSQK